MAEAFSIQAYVQINKLCQNWITNDPKILENQKN